MWRDGAEGRPPRPSGTAAPAPSLVLFSRVDLWLRDGAFKQDEADMNDAVEQLAGPVGYDSASGRMEVSGGLGIRLGAKVPTRSRGLDLGGSLGYVAGPSSTIDLRAVSAVAGNGAQRSEDTTRFWRALAEASKTVRLRPGVDLKVHGGVGYAWGRIESQIQRSGSFVSVLGLPASSRYSERWSGPTWELTPSLIFKGPSFNFEVGFGFSGFPRLGEKAFFNEWTWQPLGLLLGLGF